MDVEFFETDLLQKMNKEVNRRTLNVRQHPVPTVYILEMQFLLAGKY